MTAEKIKCSIVVVAALLVQLCTFSQITQTIRGEIVDAVLQKPLSGATVYIKSINKSTKTQPDGSFRLMGVPIGTYEIEFSYNGYRKAYAYVNAYAGKEAIVRISMNTEVGTPDENFETIQTPENNPTSTHRFGRRETEEFAGSLNDPLRMSTSFAGIVAANNSNNEIVIRGNSPTGLLWRMEGLDIPNPNHLSTPGSSGGGLAILNPELLSNSFINTGAFNAEYGNALSGVVDVKMRKGNNEQKEYSLQAGTLGLNISFEGPITPFYKGSKLFSYRYSSLSILDALGMKMPAGLRSNYQDVSYNVYIPTERKGEFTFFGFAGLSAQRVNAEEDTTQWKSYGDRINGKVRTNTFATGLTHTIPISSNGQFHSSVIYSLTDNKYNELYFVNSDITTDSYNDRYKTAKWTFSSSLNQRFGSKNIFRTGIIANSIHFKYYQRTSDHPSLPAEERINTDGKTFTFQGYGTWQFRPTANLTFNSGLDYIVLFLNKSYSIEPRSSVQWDVDDRNSISFAYGLHSQVLPLGIYFTRKIDEGVIQYPNRDLEFTKARHYVLSYQHLFSRQLRLRGELYYQDLYNIPVSVYDTSSFSLINLMGNFTNEPLVNKGTGKNYGVEVSLEKQFTNDTYFLLSQSVYQSKYTAADGIERNTRFNGNYITNATVGKNFASEGRKRILGIHLKMVHAGGFRTTPIDLEKSRQQGRPVVDANEAFSLKSPVYFRADLRLSLTWNRPFRTSSLSLDLQNLSNRNNFHNQYIDPFRGSVSNTYLTGLIPVLNYKLEF